MAEFHDLPVVADVDRSGPIDREGIGKDHPEMGIFSQRLVPWDLSKTLCCSESIEHARNVRYSHAPKLSTIRIKVLHSVSRSDRMRATSLRRSAHHGHIG